MRKKEFRYFVGDFETTVYEGQEYTEVWASALVELGSEDVIVMHSIEETFSKFLDLKCNIVVYYHNLKFDGEFWVSYLLRKNFKLAMKKIKTSGKEDTYEWLEERWMYNNTFKVSISEMGQWYSIIIKVKNHFIEIRDSLKLLPFSLKKIGKSFGTKHQKLDMEYKGFRYAGCRITPEEESYIKNDVLVIKEALEIMFEEGHKSLTIGSCCLSEYKEICKGSLKNELSYEEMFPNLYDIEIDKDKYGMPNAGLYIRKSYRGGWTYLTKGKEDRIYYNGTTADVNSLYPSVMHSDSKSRYPVGVPHFWKGNYIDGQALKPDRYYFIRIRTRFYLKEGHLPFIQIKDSFLYKGNECLETSDWLIEGKYYSHIEENGELRDTHVTMTLTMTDFDRIKEHYHLVELEILDGCWFYSQTGIFDEYIDKYKEIKVTAKGARRELAKLFLNNLYGKMATSTDSSFKYPVLEGGGIVKYRMVHEEKKKPGYIAVGSAITSYARDFTIRAAQKNYHGVDNPGFIYADTDSIHCDLLPDEIIGIKVDDNAFCHWKLESCWDEAIFVRQKTYIEHVVKENLEECAPYHNIKCCGMPESCKGLFLESMEGAKKEWEEYTKDEREFLFDGAHNKIIRTYADFKRGLDVPGKLRPKRVKGGIVLVDCRYKMR